MAEQAGAELISDDLDDDNEGLDLQGDQSDTNDQGDALDGDEDEVEISFGDEAAPASGEGKDSNPIRALRERNREQAAEIARLKAQAPKPQVIELGDKPTLEACEYDGERFEAEILAWNARKTEADKANAKRDEETKVVREEFTAALQGFATSRDALKAKDFDIAESAVTAALTVDQQSALVLGVTDSAKLVYALGKNPDRLKALAAIKNPIKFAVAAAKLESTMKFAPRRRAPEPEGTVRGSAPLSQGSDKHLERLEAKAEKSGDRTEVLRYKRELKQKATAKH